MPLAARRHSELMRYGDAWECYSPGPEVASADAVGRVLWPTDQHVPRTPSLSRKLRTSGVIDRPMFRLLKLFVETPVQPTALQVASFGAVVGRFIGEGRSCR